MGDNSSDKKGRQLLKKNKNILEHQEYKTVHTLLKVKKNVNHKII
jgi:hypothetical protein